MFVELHIIQNFAPSNLNRDDTNNPKDCEFGGVRRARLSSQCIKRAIRLAPVFARTTGVDVAKRTKYLVNQLKTPLVQAGKSEEEALEVLTRFVPEYASKLEKSPPENPKTAVLLYLGQAEMDALAGALLDHWDDLSDEKAFKGLVRDLVKAHKGQTSAPDIALFGRMLAEKPELGLEAACQVAHAISTHRATMEMDFYTAVDDLKPDDTAGAAMMGFTGFDSPCYYRYARIDWEKLAENLNGDADLARRTVEGFLRASVEAVPTGKQNAFAANNPPSLLLAAVREDGMAWSLANAFEKPVRPSGDAGLVEASIAALDNYWGHLCRAYGANTLTCTAALVLDPDAPLDNLRDAVVEDLGTWVGAVIGALPN
jgi:CRISPR system Cascade subunit CasC